MTYVLLLYFASPIVKSAHRGKVMCKTTIKTSSHVPDQVFLVTLRRCLQSRLDEGLRKFILDT